jgi:hypothetical protein
MTGIYYTTADIKEIFCFKSATALNAKIREGFLPEPDLEGRPNKWLKVRIDAIVDELNDYQKDDA